MASEVTLNLMVQDANNKLQTVSDNMFPPLMGGSYEYISSVAEKLNAFLSETNLSGECDGRIAYIVPPVITDESSTGNYQSDLVLAYIDSSNLTDMLDGSVALPVNNPLAPTVFVLPAMNKLSLPAVPTVPTPPTTPQSYDTSTLFTSGYLTTVENYVTSLSNGTIPADVVDSLQIAAERLDYDLDKALRQALAQTGARGFRKPNSSTTYAMREVYVKYLDAVQNACSEFTGAVFELLAGAKSLGVSSEQIQIDFTTGLNDLALAITAFQIKRYEDAISDSVAAYNLAVAKVNAQLQEGQYRIKRSMFDIRDMLLSLSTESTSSELSADHTKNLLAFADVYKDGNQAWLKEKQQQAQVETFNIQSEQSESLLDLEAEIQGFVLSNNILKANNAVLVDKLKILKTDLAAYAALVDVIPIDLQESSAEFDLLSKEFNLKLLSAAQIPKILEGAGNIITGMLKANIVVNKTKGTS